MHDKALETKLAHHHNAIRAHWNAIARLQESYIANARNGDRVPFDSAPVHLWFELSYASYLTIPRVFLEAMPLVWQQQFVACLEELDETFDWRPDDEHQYRVTLHEIQFTTEGAIWGRSVDDPFANYRYPVKLPWRSIDEGAE